MHVSYRPCPPLPAPAHQYCSPLPPLPTHSVADPNTSQIFVIEGTQESSTTIVYDEEGPTGEGQIRSKMRQFR